jgi:hypothetical protein
MDKAELAKLLEDEIEDSSEQKLRPISIESDEV